MANITRLREKPNDSEKITINLGYVDLGRIDLLVREGFYSSRSDLIRTAIRDHLNAHATALREAVERHTLDTGLRDITRVELEAARDRNEVLHIKVIGLARIAEDVDVDLATATIGTITVLGALQARREIKAALADRMT